jgi:ribosome biogenesis GTPase
MKKEKKNRGKVVKATRNFYVVNLGGNTFTCSIRGRVAGDPGSEQTAVKVGDDVLITKISGSEGVIEKILPRRSKLSRTVEGKAYREHIIAVNIDQILVITSTKRPAFKSGLLDRYLIIAEQNGLEATICINKIDLVNPEEFEVYREWYGKLGYPVVITSAGNGYGLEEFEKMLMGKVSALVGHSGVGKSSLVQKIKPELNLKIADISDKTKKGVHATTHVQLFSLAANTYIIDTPGIRELGLWDIFRDDLKSYYIEFTRFEDDCQFKNCQHLQEPGCAVKSAVEEGKIFSERYRNYRNIYDDLRRASYESIKFR